MYQHLQESQRYSDRMPHDCVIIECSLAVMEHRETCDKFLQLKRHKHDVQLFSRK